MGHSLADDKTLHRKIGFCLNKQMEQVKNLKQLFGDKSTTLKIISKLSVSTNITELYVSLPHQIQTMTP